MLTRSPGEGIRKGHWFAGEDEMPFKIHFARVFVGFGSWNRGHMVHGVQKLISLCVYSFRLESPANHRGLGFSGLGSVWLLWRL